MSMHGGKRRFIVAGLQCNIAKTVGGEVSAKDEYFAVIVPLNARVVEDGLPHFVENRQMGGCPRRTKRRGVILFHELAERRNSHLEMGYEARIKLEETNKLGNIPNNNRGSPMVQELVL